MPRWKRPRSLKRRYQKMRKKNKNATVAKEKPTISEDCDETFSSASEDSSCSWSPRSWSPDVDDSPPSPILYRRGAKRKAEPEVLHKSLNTTSHSQCSKNELEVVTILPQSSGEIFGDSFIKDRLIQLPNSVVVPVNPHCTLVETSHSNETNLVMTSNKLSTGPVNGLSYLETNEFAYDLVPNEFCIKVEHSDELSNLVQKPNEISTTSFSNNFVDTPNELTNLGPAPYGLSNTTEQSFELCNIKQENEFHESVFIKEEPHEYIQQDTELEIKQESDDQLELGPYTTETVFINEFPLETKVKEEKLDCV